jgi:SAM-dependent methyltransferase
LLAEGRLAAEVLGGGDAGWASWTPRTAATAWTPAGEAAAHDADPGLERPAAGLTPARWRWLLVRLRVDGGGRPTTAQWFWDDGRGFAEGRSVRWSVPADGRWHARLVDLAGTPWAQAGPLRAVRLDPAELAAPFALGHVALLPDVPELAPTPDLRATLAARHLHGRGLECGALQNPLAVGADARVVYIDRLTAADARAHYPELRDLPLVAPHLVGDTQCLPVRDAAFDFCIGNHLLEHARDPISALAELLRVVRPGGHLFVSVPDVGNPLDRGRPVTPFAHLVADHAAGPEGRPAEDRRHYAEAIRSAHPEMSAERQAALEARWLAQAYSIHFHTFDADTFHRLLLAGCGEAGAQIVERAQATCAGGDFDEHLAVLRRTGGGHRPA